MTVPSLLLKLLFFCATAGAAPLSAPLVVPPVGHRSPEALAALQSGRDLLQQGDAAGAEAAWRQGLALGDDNGLLYSLGGLLFQTDRLRQAEACFQRLVQDAPDWADAWFQLGLVRAARGRYKDAVDAQRLAVGHAPQFSQAYCALALDLRETGKISEALHAAEEAIRLMPGYAGAWNLRAALEQDQGDDDSALRDYQQALRLQPRYAGAWFNLAEMQDKRSQKSEAFKSYTYALQMKPDMADAWLQRAELSLDRHDWDAAEADFKAVTRISGSEAEAWWGLSRVAKARGQKSEAAECLVRYRSAVRRRDRTIESDREKGIETPVAYEPGLPLASSQAPVLTP